MSEGLADTSVVIDFDYPALVAALPDMPAISNITLAELADGPDVARDPLYRTPRD